MTIRQPVSSPRLTLRSFHPADTDDLYACLSDERIYQFEPGEPISLEQARKMAQELSTSPDSWAIELQEP